MSIIRKFDFLPNPKLRRLRCIYATIDCILEYYGLNDLVAYMGKECVFYEHSSEFGIPHIWRRTKDVYDDLSSSHGFVFKHNKFDSPKSAWGHLEHNLSENILGLLNLDTFYIPYSSYFQKEHRWHSLCVNGYSPETKKIVIYDPGFRFYNKEVDISTIEGGWAARGFSFIDFARSGEIRELDLAHFYSVLQWNARQMFNPEIGRLYGDNTQVTSLPDFENLSAGFAAMKRLCGLISALNSGDEIKPRILRLSDMFGQIAEQTELHYWFLQNMSEKFALSEIGTLANEMQYISQKWSILRVLLLKAAVRPESGIFLQSVKIAETVEHLERNFFTRIEAVAR